MVKDTIMDPRTQSLIGFFISQRIQTEAHVNIGKRNYGSRNTISDRDLYLTQDDTSKHKHTGRQEQRSARYKQMQEHNETSGTGSRAVVVLHYITRCTNVLVKNGIRG